MLFIQNCGWKEGGHHKRRSESSAGKKIERGLEEESTCWNEIGLTRIARYMAIERVSLSNERAQYIFGM